MKSGHSVVIDRPRVLPTERADRIGVGAPEFRRHERELRALLGCPVGPADVFWSLANRRLLAAGRAGDWAAVARTYREMAELLVSEGRPADALAAEAGIADERASSRA